MAIRSSLRSNVVASPLRSHALAVLAPTLSIHPSPSLILLHIIKFFFLLSLILTVIVNYTLAAFNCRPRHSRLLRFNCEYYYCTTGINRVRRFAAFQCCTVEDIERKRTSVLQRKQDKRKTKRPRERLFLSMRQLFSRRMPLRFHQNISSSYTERRARHIMGTSRK